MAAPRGEVRRAVVGVIQEGPCTLVDVVNRTQMDYGQVKAAIQNAMRSGELHIVGHEKRAHAKCWLRVYEVAPPASPEPDTFDSDCNFVDLNRVFAGWGR